MKKPYKTKAASFSNAISIHIETIAFTKRNARNLTPGHNNNRHLTYNEVENSIGGFPVTDNRIQDLFDSRDVEHTGTVSVDVLKGFLGSLEHFGVPVHSERSG